MANMATTRQHHKTWQKMAVSWPKTGQRHGTDMTHTHGKDITAETWPRHDTAMSKKRDQDMGTDMATTWQRNEMTWQSAWQTHGKAMATDGHEMATRMANHMAQRWQGLGEDMAETWKTMARTWHTHGKYMAKTRQLHCKDIARPCERHGANAWQRHGKDMATQN